MLLVMQRLHEDDPAGYLLATGQWDHLNLPAIVKETEDIPIGNGQFFHREPGDLLHPARLSLEYLEGQRQLMGSAMFEAQYQQSPIPDGGKVIKREWLQWYTVPPPLNDCRITQRYITRWRDVAAYLTCVKGASSRADRPRCIPAPSSLSGARCARAR